MYSGLLRMADLLTMQPLVAKLKRAEGLLQHMKPSFLDELAESYDPAEAFED